MKNTNSLHRDARSGAVITPAQSIKLGLDVHADSIVVARIVDGQSPQPAQRFAPEAFLAWAQKQLGLASQVFSCYEAGPLGYIKGGSP